MDFLSWSKRLKIIAGRGFSGVQSIFDSWRKQDCIDHLINFHWRRAGEREREKSTSALLSISPYKSSLIRLYFMPSSLAFWFNSTARNDDKNDNISLQTKRRFFTKQLCNLKLLSINFGDTSSYLNKNWQNCRFTSRLTLAKIEGILARQRQNNSLKQFPDC